MAHAADRLALSYQLCKHRVYLSLLSIPVAPSNIAEACYVAENKVSNVRHSDQ